MITKTLKTWFGTIKAILTNLRAFAIFAVLYAVLLVTLYGFIATREATVWQVVITYFFLVLIPAEFFIFQASILDHAHDQKFHWRAILIDALKLLVVTIPIIIVAWVLLLLLNKWQAHFPAPLAATLPVASAPPKPQPLHWPTLLFSTLRFVLLGVMLPLATIHFWIGVAGCEVRTWFEGGAKALLKRIGSTLSCAFASESVLTYALGLLLFVLIPYAILFVPVSVKGNKTDFAVFVLRLLLAFAFTLIGWIVTVTTLTKTRAETSTLVAAKTIPDAPAEAPA